MEEPHRFTLRVYYEDTDMGGIVYHANYLRYIERARSDWVRGMGIDQMEMRAEGRVFAVRRIEADYLAPARLDEILEVETTVVAAGPARMGMRQEISRDGKIIFRADVTLVCIGQGGQPVRLPAELRHIGAGGASREGHTPP
ncbi:tol-pal system-associated acyl-CoA thioesterase [Sulfitobacter sp. LCG007]